MYNSKDKGMTDEECEKIKAEYDINKAPYMDIRCKDGKRFITRQFTCVGGGGGGSSTTGKKRE